MRRELMVVSDVRTMALLADPLKAEILREMDQPRTTADLALAMGMPRQKLGYHVRKLEGAGLLANVGESRRGNCVARKLQTAARRIIVVQADSNAATLQDRFTVSGLVESCARTIREVGVLSSAAGNDGEKQPMLTLDTEIAFDNAQEQQAFAQELNELIAALVDRYGSTSSGARCFRLVAASYPKPPDG
ncbi:MAG: helix-turn-helix transcriptional regulator [Proteobacteria bacterium]|nr:helix-turn-helix transcriptional regulator [Pseudomonadota bacterium]MCH9026445.1 helix-turn-helix transcriptional regulator [Pseudomonadota bacterium]